MTGQNKKIVCAKADFAPECSQNYRNESVLDSYVVSLFNESINKDLALLCAGAALRRSRSQEPP